MMHAAEFLTRQDAARTASVSVDTIRRWLKAGLPYSQPIPGGRILIRRTDLERFLERGRRQDAAASVHRCIEDVLRDLEHNTGPKAATSEPGLRKEPRGGNHPTQTAASGQDDVLRHLKSY